MWPFYVARFSLKKRSLISMAFTMFNKDLNVFIYLVCSTTLIQSANLYGIMSYCLSYGLSYRLSYGLTERRTACVFPGGGGCRCPPGTSGQEGRHPESGRHHNHCTRCLFLNTQCFVAMVRACWFTLTCWCGRSGLLSLMTHCLSYVCFSEHRLEGFYTGSGQPIRVLRTKEME